MVTKGYGFTVNDIDMSSPSDLSPYAKAYNLEMRRKDEMQHAWWGTYGLSALTVAIDHCFSKNAKSKYMEDAILQGAYNTSKQDEEIRKQRDRFVAQLQIMQANYELGKAETE